MEPPSEQWFRPKPSERTSESLGFRPPRPERRQRKPEPESRSDIPADQWFRAKARKRRAEASGFGGPPPREVSDRRLYIGLIAFGIFVLGAMILFASRGWVP
jgi:hypothetical protein